MSDRSKTIVDVLKTSDHYQMACRCVNCYTENIIHIPKGTTTSVIWDMCTYCGCSLKNNNFYRPDVANTK